MSNAESYDGFIIDGAQYAKWGRSIFEEMRNILLTGSVNLVELVKSISISLIYFIVGIIIFYTSYSGAKDKGTLINMGE